MKQGKTFSFDPGKQDLWLSLGDIRYGLIHALSGKGKTGHLIDFLRIDQRLNDPRIIAKFIYDRVNLGKGIIMDNDGVVVYAFRFQSDPEVHYLELLIEDSPKGQITSAYPVDATIPKYVQNYLSYVKYFEKDNPSLIENDIDIKWSYYY